MEKHIASLVMTTNAGFEKLNQQMSDMRAEAAAHEGRMTEAIKGLRHEVRAVVDKVGNLERQIPEAIAEHAHGCVLNDITETRIKLPKHMQYDTPVPGGVRTSRGPRTVGGFTWKQVGFGVGVTLAVAALGIWIGVQMATGDSVAATRAVHDLAKQVTQAQKDEDR